MSVSTQRQEPSLQQVQCNVDCIERMEVPDEVTGRMGRYENNIKALMFFKMLKSQCIHKIEIDNLNRNEEKQKDRAVQTQRHF